MSQPESSYDLTFEFRPEYLYVRVEAETVSAESVTAYLHEITQKCAALGRDRLLIERDIPATLSETDTFFTGDEFAHMGIERMRIAFVDHHAENTDHLEFAMLVANNRGGHLELFNNITAAEGWLRG